MGVTFDKQTAERIGAATLYVERINRGGKGKSLNSHRTPMLGNYTAVTSSEITARDDETSKVGKGTATLQVFDLEAETFSDGESITIYNRYAVEIETNTYISVVYMYGCWWIEGADCQPIEVQIEGDFG